MLARIKGPNETFLSVLVLDEAFALSLRYDVEIIRCFGLLNFYFFGLAHHELNFCYHIIFDV